MFRTLHDPGARTVTVQIDGKSMTAAAGESVAAVLLRHPEGWSRKTPVSESPRAPYCMMGVCFECLVEIDGQGSVQACMTPVKDGMQIVRPSGRRSLSA